MRRIDVGLDEFNRAVGSDLEAVPGNFAAMAWSGRSDEWAVAFGREDRPDHRHTYRARADATVRFLDRRVRPKLPPVPYWFLMCLGDGWRERQPVTDSFRWVPGGRALASKTEWSGAPGDLPELSSQRRWLFCYCAHRNDPMAVLFPEAHFLPNQYRRLFMQLRAQRVPWRRKRARAVFAGSNHGAALDGTYTRPNSRELLRDRAAAGTLPLDVFLNQSIGRRRQLRYKYVLDVDGWVRTWDAWAWKIASGSVVLAQASPWESFFTRQFEPWEHYVPIDRDFHDLAEKLDWCRANDGECHAIAERARHRAGEIYDVDTVVDRLLPEVSRALVGNES